MLVSFPCFILFIPQTCIEFILFANYVFQNKDIKGGKSLRKVEINLKKIISQFSLSKENSIYLTHCHLGAAVETLDTSPRRTPALEAWNFNPILLTESFYNIFLEFYEII